MNEPAKPTAKSADILFEGGPWDGRVENVRLPFPPTFYVYGDPKAVKLGIDPRDQRTVHHYGYCNGIYKHRGVQ